MYDCIQPRSTPVHAVQQLRSLGLDCPVAAIAKYPEEVKGLSEPGICTACNIYEQAGEGLASHGELPVART